MTIEQARSRSGRRGRVLLLGLAVALAVATVPALPAVTAHAEAPASATRGSWHVVQLGPGRWQVAWTSPARLPVRSDRPQIVDAAGAAIGVPVTAADGRTVRTVVASPTAPVASRLGVVLSGTRLDRSTPATSRSTPAAATPRRATAAPRTLDVDPGVPGKYAVVTSDYTRPSVKLPGMKQPIEMVGHVVEPAADAATGPRPLVLFEHGRHEPCYQVGKGKENYDWPCHGVMREVPSQLGYDYVQRLLASQGYTTVSIRVNGINAQDSDVDDGGASARATMIQKHLDYWTTIAAAHQVDLSRVVLVGHSRGGEGVDRASIRIPLDAPYRIVGQVLVAPTDFANQTAPYVPTVTLLPYCDGDVSDLQGQHYTDIARDVSSDDHSFKSSVLIEGADHNYFNTEWTPRISQAPSSDDWNGKPDEPCGGLTHERLRAGEQRAVGQAYIAGAVGLFTQPTATATALLPMFDGSNVAVGSAGRAVVHTHALGGDHVLRRPGQDASLTLADGADSTLCTGSTSDDYRAGLCGSELPADITAPHWQPRATQPVRTRTFWQVNWTARGQTAGLHLTRPLDLRGRTLDLRTIVDFRTGPAAVGVRLTDSAGHSAQFTPEGGSTLAALPSSPAGSEVQIAKLWAQTVRVDPSAGGLDLAHVSDVTLVADSTRGRVWIADLAATAGTVVPAVARRMPTLSLGTLTVNEGNASGTTVARVPFRLSQPMDRPGRFRVTTQDDKGRTRVFAVDLAPGQRSGTIPVGYRADRLDSPDVTGVVITAGASTNVMTDEYLGRLLVRDDDPSPKVTVRRVHTTVAEGGSAQWRVTLAGPVGFDVQVFGTVVRGPGRDLTGADVPRTWLREHSWNPSTKQTLAAQRTYVAATMRQGARSAVLSVPIRRDGVAEPAEALTLRIEVPVGRGKTVTSTVRVSASK